MYADKSRINQIFINLINNAIKYTEKGYVELLVKKVEENNFTYKFQFCVKDTGVGIKREDSLKIFTEFEQVNDPTIKEKDGRGMGLAITKKIIENLEGKIWVESNVDLGSKFYFYIVVEKGTNNIGEDEKQNDYEEKTKKLLVDSIEILQEAKKQNNIKKEISNLKDQEEKKRVLLVEDNEINQEITKKIIEEMNTICETVLDGTQCLQRIEEVGKDYYDLILMDIHMPKRNGYEISRILKDNMEIKVPIIALTATNITDDIIEKIEII